MERSAAPSRGWSRAPRRLRRRDAPAAAAAAAAGAAPTVLLTHPATRGKVVEWYAAELGLSRERELRVELVDMERGEHKAAGFVGDFPLGQLPALRDPEEGACVWESNALLLYLADKHGALGRSLRARGDAYTWTTFASATLGPALFLPDVRKRSMESVLGALDGVLASRDYLASDGVFSVSDVAVGAILLYVPFMFPDLDLSPWPAVTAFMRRLSAREAYQATLGARIAGAGRTAPPPPPTRGGVPAEQ